MAAKFTWDHPCLKKQDFVALTNLLSLRSNGQVKPSSNDDIDQDEQASGKDYAESIDTTSPQQISEFGNDKLKKRFLDVMAEFASREAGGSHVTCTAIRAHGENSEIYVARNEPFDDYDKDFFFKFGSLLNEWSRLSASQKAVESPKSSDDLFTKWFDWSLSPETNALAAHTEKIWSGMLSYQSTKIQTTYIPRLKRSLKKCNENLVFGPDIVVQVRLQYNEFRDRVLNKESHQLTLTECGKFVTEAYDIWRARDAKHVNHLLNDSPPAFTDTRKLWENIYYLGRLQGAFATIKESLATIPSFSRIKFTLVEAREVLITPLQNKLGLEVTFKLLGLHLDSATIKQDLVKSLASCAGAFFSGLELLLPEDAMVNSFIPGLCHQARTFDKATTR
ncbi:hypothetical protein HYALB_00004219 [Hymenoscyphus albidus]|uniref:Uncharacterized protein n=1 Tax=Hymenoscyphus albidus TaxID=595503 RepID=A0A9N9M4W1_9HELO|nr:hypothetical protein HYALB_00004219 [Hymenoscyphus albidus]